MVFNSEYMNNVQHKFSRTELLIGCEGLEKLKESKVVVVGVGGVGSFTVEALARAGVGTIVLVDDDNICLTNLNRQIHALYSTIAKSKVEVMRDRIYDINPECIVKIFKTYVKEDNISEIIEPDTDYVVDAIDTVTSKISLIMWCKEHDMNIISCMGTGNKFDPTRFKIADIYDTKSCPLAKVMRHELKRREVKSLKVLYSDEIPVEPRTDVVTCKSGCICTKGSSNKCKFKRQIPGSISFVPSVAGLIIGGEVIKDILGINKK